MVMDLETGGFNASTDALLECAIVMLYMDDDGIMLPGERAFFNIKPFEGAVIEQASLEFTGIDPEHPFRMAVAVEEKQALTETFQIIRREIRHTGCNRAVMVAHNAAFDQAFLMAAAARAGVKRNPFHPFSNFDTATLCGLAFGQTVLARACEVAGVSFNAEEAHSAKYDADKTAELFCYIVNKWQQLGGMDDI